MEALGTALGPVSRADLSSRRDRRFWERSWGPVTLGLLFAVAAVSGAGDSPVTSNVGRIFSFLLPGDDVLHQGAGPVLLITSPPAPGRGSTHVRVVVRGAEFTESVLVDPGTTGVARLPPTAVGVGTGRQRGTVRVEAASPVAIQAVVGLGSRSTEALLVLPLESLGREYTASSTTRNVQSSGETAQAVLTITGVCDGSSVSVKAVRPLSYLGVVYKAGRTLRVMVDDGESIQIRTNGRVTGTRVVSDKPIAVLVASACPASGAEEYHCYYSVEQLPPVYALGKQFLLSQLAADVDSGVIDEVLVLAARAGTTVEILGSGLSRRLSRGEQWMIPASQISTPLFLVADKPVQVTQYAVVLSDADCSSQQESCTGRYRTMTLVPPVEQFTDRADFTVLGPEVTSPDADAGEMGRRTQTFLTVLTDVACDDIAAGITSGQSDSAAWAKVGVSNKTDACVLKAEVQPGTVHLDAEMMGATGAKFAALLSGVIDRRAYASPVTSGGTHLRYISREIERHECTVDSFDPCEANPCQHSGDCIRDGDGYQCSCISPFYEGPHCETEVDPCSFAVPWCFNGGTCREDRECVCPPGWGGKNCERDVNAQAAPSTGREFVLTFTEHPSPRRSPSIVVSTARGDGSPALVNVSVPASGFAETFLVPQNRAEIVRIPVESISTGSRRQPSGVLVAADGDLTVVGFHNGIAPGDGFLALPVAALGNRHHVVAARQRKKRRAEKSQLAVVAASDATTVRIRIRVPAEFEGKAYAAYSSIATELRRLEVAQLQSRFDLTGAEISSDKPVAVFSGSTCGYTLYDGDDRRSCGFMVEQLPPVRSWGRRFVATPFAGNSNGETTVRIIGGPGKTQFGDGSPSQGFLYDGSMQELYITRPTYISATQPVLVVAFSAQATSDCAENNFDDCRVVSSPTMTVVPSLNQFTTSAVLSTPSVANTYSLSYKNYVNVVASDCSDIRLSRLSETPTGTTEWDDRDSVRVTDLCFVSKRIDPGQYLVDSVSGEVVFTAQLYGFNNYGSAYGFPLTQNGQNAEVAGTSTGSEGKDFVLTFLSGGNYYPTQGPRLLITSTTDAAKTEVRVTGNDVDETLTLAPHEVRVVDVPPALIGVSGHRPYPDVAVRVRSSHDITVAGMNDAYVTTEGHETVSDGYLALPVPALGREYSVVTSWPIYQQYPERYMQFAIIGVYDVTRVDIALNSAVFFDGTLWYGGSLKTIRLSKGQVAFFKSYNDHTGTRVVSTKPVAVIAGTDCGFAPRYPDDGPLDDPCDHQVEFLMPESSWGQTFLLAPLQGYQGGDIFVKIQTPHHFTRLVYGSGANAQPLRATRFNVGHRGYINSTILSSNKRVSVTGFTVYQPLLDCASENGSECEGHSRPVMFTVPPVERFGRRVVFPSYRIRGADDMANYADVYAKCSQADSVLVNGVRGSWGHPLEEIQESGYCVLRLRLASDATVTSYTVESSLADGRLGVITYGFSTRSGYAFPGGLK